MICRTFSKTAMLAVALAVALPSPANASEEWGYEHGTEQWGHLDPAYAGCSTGLQQSPIDVIRANTVHKPLPNLRFHYASSATVDVANLGHTIQGIPPGTANTLASAARSTPWRSSTSIPLAKTSSTASSTRWRCTSCTRRPTTAWR